MHHVWACDHHKTTINAAEFKKAHKRRSDMVKNAIDAAAGGTREQLVDAIVSAINAGGLFVVDMDIIHSQIGQNAHVILPACESNEMNLTSMNGERRMRLSEKYMDPYGNSKPDCLIAAGIAQNMERVLREMGHDDYADKFKGYDWETEEDAFMDGFHQGNPDVTYDRLRAAGNNGVQEPVVGYRERRVDRHRAALCRWQVRPARARRQEGAVLCLGLARLAGTGPRPRKGRSQILDQQRPGQHLLAEPVPRPEERLRAGPLPLSVHRDEPR
ncbi:MAG: molybdopterin-dependent oxidoreductase [Roseovarius sp.]|nr:molybdopterin-dependent oxidoreductase [Roseovarius sp.]